MTNRSLYNTTLTLLLCLVATLMLCACGGSGRTYRIGVSQCSDDAWRADMNNDMRREADCIGGISLHFRSADDDSYRQSADIDSFIDEGVDLLIVAPNEARGVTAAIRRARSKGIPVIMADRRTDTEDYDAFVGANNYELGQHAGANAIARLRGTGRVLELMGTQGSTPADERHRGFVDALQKAPGIKILDSVDVEWDAERAEDYVLHMIAGGGEQPDLVFCHNDRMARAVHMAYAKVEEQTGHHLTQPIIIGVDGLAGKDRGIDLVEQRAIAATFIYPAGGATIVQVADSLLRGLKPHRDTRLPVALVDTTNVHIVASQLKMMAQEETQISRLNERLNSTWKSYNTQNVIIIACVVIIALIGIVVALILRAYRQKVETTNLLHQKIQELEQQKRLVEEQTRKLENQRQQLLVQRTQLAMFTASQEDDESQDFITGVRDVIQEHLSDSGFGVTELAEAMCLSRAQLFRRVKEACKCSPQELIRTARLKRAAELFKKTDKSIAEVCYATGFSSPSYFTRCYKTYFDEAPRSFKRQAKEGEDEAEDVVNENGATATDDVPTDAPTDAPTDGTTDAPTDAPTDGE